MGNTSLSFLTVQQIASRWDMDILDVHQLILTGRLTQSYLLSGRATITRGSSGGSPEVHALCDRGPAHIRVLTRGMSGTQNRHSWPLADVQDVYECASDGYNQAHPLQQLCIEERASRSGWMLSFETDSLQVAGEDSFQLALKALRETALISLSSITEYEQQLLDDAGRPPDFGLSQTAGDPRRHSCRAVAKILWARDATATIPDLHQSEWIRLHACDGKPPSERTFREWVKDLNPNRSPGRRAA